MKEGQIKNLSEFYRQQLIEDIIPFWMKYSLDKQNGGYYTCLDRDGSIYNTDKYAWPQGRGIWMFSKLYNEFEPRKEWLEAAGLGVKFLCRYCFNPEGHMYFSLTFDGKPLYRPWGIFSEAFAVIGLSEYAKASGDRESLERAKKIYWNIIDWLNHPEEISSYVVSETRKIETLSVPMILLSITQELRQVAPDPRFDKIITDCLEKILYKHARDEYKALFENISSDESKLNSPQGRCLIPGHAIECAWFILREGKLKHNEQIINRALKILDWSLEWGWDKDFGGLLYYVDSEGKPPEQLEWNMKLWWPHTEALYALLLAYQLSGKEKYWAWHKKVHEWTFRHFPDPEYGEWFGYLDREGKPSLYLKGSMWKGNFHLPRALFLCTKVLKEL